MRSGYAALHPHISHPTHHVPHSDAPPSLQAVEELLESLDLEKSSYHMGLSRVGALQGHPCSLWTGQGRCLAQGQRCALPLRHSSGNKSPTQGHPRWDEGHGAGDEGEHPIPVGVTLEGCWRLTALLPSGVFPCWLTGQVGGAAGRADQQEHHPVPGGVQGLPGTAALQEEEGS